MCVHYVSLKYITAITKISFPPSIYEIRGDTMNVNRISSTDITDIFAGHFLRGFERDRKKERKKEMFTTFFSFQDTFSALYTRDHS